MMLLEDVNVNYLKSNDNVEIKRARPYVTRMSSVCHSYVLVCHPYVIRIYSYVTRMLFYHEPLRNGFTQVVTKPTRITMESSTHIDIIATTKPEFIKIVEVIAASLSDHDMVCSVRKINHQKSPMYVTCRNYKMYNPNVLKNDFLCK